MSLHSFFESIKAGIEKITGYIALAINILTQFNGIMPTVVAYVIEAVLMFFPKVDSGEVSGPEAREAIVTDTMNHFHGSGSVLLQEDVRTIVDQVVKLEKARRRGTKDIQDKERIAFEKGYIGNMDDVKEIAAKIDPAFKLFGA